ncbi:MAG: lysostaphin resistance A-like protein [Candidatus Fervidibacter sp.]|uniref:lysostaphin resistance A-like protein n=1 Tax=Candidatus Fervidibacter sp. TaxID=3100871 RepID=UPI00404B03BC
MVTGKDAWKLVGIFLVCCLLTQAALFLALPSIKMRLTVDLLVFLNSLVLFLILLLPAFLFGLARRWNFRKAFRLRPVSWLVTGVTVLGTFALGMTVSQITLWLIQSLRDSPLVKESNLTNLLLATARSESPILLLVGLMLPALPEELVFRGVVQQGFEKRYSPAIAIGLASFIFALFHLDIIQSLSVVAIALFWGWVVWRSQSVLPSLIAHALQNGLTFISVFNASVSDGGMDGSFGVLSTSPNLLAALFGLLVWIVTVLILNRSLPRPGEGNGSTRGTFTHQVGAPGRSDGGGSFGIDEFSGPES